MNTFPIGDVELPSSNFAKAVTWFRVWEMTTTSGVHVEVLATGPLNGLRLLVGGEQVTPKKPGGVGPFPLPKPQVSGDKTITSVIGCRFGGKLVGLTDEQVSEIKANVAALDPEMLLRNERERLKLAYLGAIDAQQEAFEKAHAAEDAGAWDIKKDHEPRIQSAWEALKAFDKAHPEAKGDSMDAIIEAPMEVA